MKKGDVRGQVALVAKLFGVAAKLNTGNLSTPISPSSSFLQHNHIGTIFSLRAALVAVSIILSPVLVLFVFASRKAKPEAVPIEEVVITTVSDPV